MAEFAHVHPRAAAAHVRTDDAGDGRRGGAVGGQYASVRPIGQMDLEWLEMNVVSRRRARIRIQAADVCALQLPTAGCDEWTARIAKVSARARNTGRIDDIRCKPDTTHIVVEVQLVDGAAMWSATCKAVATNGASYRCRTDACPSGGHVKRARGISVYLRLGDPPRNRRDPCGVVEK